MKRLFGEPRARRVVAGACATDGFEYFSCDEIAQITLGLLHAEIFGVLIARTTDSAGHCDVVEGGNDPIVAARARCEA